MCCGKTVNRWNALNSYLLFDENTLFCILVEQKLNNSWISKTMKKKSKNSIQLTFKDSGKPSQFNKDMDELLLSLYGSYDNFKKEFKVNPNNN